MKQDFFITEEDYNNSSKDFSDMYKCPMKQAFVRQFPSFSKGQILVNPKEIIGNDGQVIGKLATQFGEEDFLALRDDRVTFYSTIELIKSNTEKDVVFSEESNSTYMQLMS